MTPSSLTSWTAGVRKDVLSNGLTVLVQRDRSAPVAAVVTHVKAGFFDEPDRWTGISHVLEHMFFKGTPSRGPGQIARETKLAGGYLNASTTYDHTTYYAVLPAERLREAVTIQADGLRNAAIDPDELARELQVIIQEARRKLDTPSAVTHETLHEVMYDRHRIRRWRIGYEAALAGFTREDVAGYYHSRYVPSRVIVAIVGDVAEEEALALAKEHYGDWAPAAAAHDPSPAELPRRDVRARTLRGDVSQAELAVGWRGVPPLDPRAIALDVAAGVLAAGRGSWLYRTLRESGLATAVSAHHYAPTELGVFSIGADCDAERVPVVLDGIAQSVERLLRHDVQAGDLERARTLLLSRWSRRMEEMDGRAAALAGAEALEDFGLLDREFEQLARTTATEVKDAAAEILDLGAVAAVLYLPREKGADLDADGLRHAFRARRLAPLPEVPPAAPGRRAPRPSIAPTARSEVMHEALPGFDLLVRHKPGVPVVSLGVYLPRVAFDPAGQAGISALAVRGAVRGAGGHDAASLAFSFERLGGTLVPVVALDWVGFATSVLSSNLGDAAALLDLVLHQPAYEESQLQAERRLLVEETTQAADDMFRYPFQLAFGAAFGDRGYGIPAAGLPDQLAGLDAGRVRAWHRSLLTVYRGVVVAVGDLSPETALATLGGVFAGHPPRAAMTLRSPVGWALGAHPVSRVVRRQKAQSAFALAFPGPSRRDPTRIAAEVWAAVASGLGGRLFEALRERRSLAYTVVASSWQKARSGAFLAYIATAPEREVEARREMLAELGRFASERVTPTELHQATRYLAGQTAVQRQSSSAVAGEILEAWLAGMGLDDLADPAARYLSVTADQVRAAAQQALGEGEPAYAEGIVQGAGTGN
jgi:zinc protease